MNSSLNNINGKLLLSVLVTLAVGFGLPVFTGAYDTMDMWADQSQALKDLQRIIEMEYGDVVGASWAGPGWLALAKTFHILFGVDLKNSLILLNRIGYLASVFFLSNFVFKQIDYKWQVKAFAGSIILFTFFLSTNFTYASVIPWSHFVSLPFAVLSVYLIGEFKNKKLAPFLFGLVFGLLATIRLFSAQALFAAILVWSIYYLLRKGNPIEQVMSIKSGILLCVLGCALGYSFNGLILGELSLFKQYAGLTPYPLSELYTLRITDFPYKFVQLFIDPCFYTDCSINSWSKQSKFIFGDGLSSWGYPLILQMPILGWVAVIWLLIITTRYRKTLKLLDDPVIAVSLLAAGAIILGYSSALITGGDRLKYGYVRDFMDAAFFLAMASVRAIVFLSKKPEEGGRSRYILITICLAPLISIFGLQYLIKEDNFLKFPDYAIKKIGGDVSCSDDHCRIAPYYITSSGKYYFSSRHDDAVVRITCMETKEVNFWYGHLSKFKYSKGQCTKGAEIAFIPTITSASTRIVVPSYDGVSGGIVYADTKTPSVINRKILFGQNGSEDRFLVGGWSVKEDGFRWTDGHQAGLVFPVGEKQKLVLKATFAGYVRPEHPQLQVHVDISGERLGTWTVASSSFEEYTMNIPERYTSKNSELFITFVIDEPISPKKITGVNDNRALGIAMRSIAISE